VDVKTFGKESHSFLAGITSVKSFIWYYLIIKFIILQNKKSKPLKLFFL
jgi:hypothetical protein